MLSFKQHNGSCAVCAKFNCDGECCAQSSEEQTISPAAGRAGNAGLDETIPLPRGSEQSREDLIKRLQSGCDPNPNALMREAAEALALSTAHAEGLGKEEYGVQTHVEPQHCTGWRPIDSAPRGEPLTVLLSDGQGVLIGGRSWICTGEQHPTNFWHTQSGSGWNPNFKFVPTHWAPLPAPPSSGEQYSQSEPQASAGQDALDTISILQARQRELETERDEWKQRAEDARYLGDNHHNAIACPHCNPSRIVPAEMERRVRELEEALRTILDGLIASRDCIDVDDWIEIAEAALLSPPTLEKGKE